METKIRPTIRDYVKERGITAVTVYRGPVQDGAREKFGNGHCEYDVELWLGSPVKGLRASYHCNPLYHMDVNEIDKAIPVGERHGSPFHHPALKFKRSGAMSLDQEKYNKLAEKYCAPAFKVDPADMLDCLLLDASGTDGTFEDWASELGYDADSRKAEATFRACQESAAKLRRWLGAAELERLMNDYDRL